MASNRQKIIVLLLITLAALTTYLFWDLPDNWRYAMSLRIPTISAILVTGTAVGIATLIFNTIVNNRVVTPQALGLDKLYELSKTMVIYIWGSSTLMSMHVVTDYLFSVGAMVGFALLLYHFFFKDGRQNVYFLLLVGLICYTLFDNMTTFFQVLLDPDEFQVATYVGFASFNVVKIPTLVLASITILPILFFAACQCNRLDVLELGRDHALNLGIDYDKICRILMVLVAVALASATALSGPMMFLGLLVLNITLEIFKTHYHKFLLPGIVLVSILALIIGQFIVFHLLNLKTTLSVIINFVGGIYFFWILLKENRKWQ